MPALAPSSYRRGLLIGIAITVVACSAFTGAERDSEVTPSSAGDAGLEATTAADGGPPVGVTVDAEAGAGSDAATASTAVTHLTFDPGTNQCARLTDLPSTTVQERDGFCRICQGGSQPTYGAFVTFEAVAGTYTLEARARQVAGTQAPSAFSLVLRSAGAATPSASGAELPLDFATLRAQSDVASGGARAYLVANFEGGAPGSCFDVDEIILTRSP